MSLPQKSESKLGRGQYRRGSVGESLADKSQRLLILNPDPTLLRYGTDRVQQRLLSQSIDQLQRLSTSID